METIENVKKRPTFLTVLGILSFVGVGLQIIGSVLKLLQIAGNRAMLLEVKDMLQGTSELTNALGGGQLEAASDSPLNLQYRYLENGYLIESSWILGAVFCLLGVFIMWRLKKSGYFIYIIGQLFPVILYFAVMGMGGFLDSILIIATSIFSLIFIILYGLNLKHMS